MTDRDEAARAYSRSRPAGDALGGAKEAAFRAGWDAAMEWRPIDSAPDDGTVFDAWCTVDEGYTDAPKRVPNCRYVDGELQYRHSHGWFPFFGSLRKRVITHWMPLPQPPASTGEGA